MAELRQERQENVAILTLDRPVANALVSSLRAELAEALEAALSDADVRAIVLRSAGADFSIGLDLTEYDAPAQSPQIGDLCLQIENSPKPVIAALHGTVAGAGFELALAAHLRIAAEGTRVGLPEISLGLIPSGGATQRLPRMVGGQVALDLMLSGQLVGVSDPQIDVIIDKVVLGPPREAAVVVAQEVAASGEWVRAQDRFAGLSDPLAYQRSAAGIIANLRNKNSAEADIVHCVEAAQLLPYARGLELERTLYDERLKTPDARARRHICVAERRAMIMAERATGRANVVSDVLIPGTGALVTELSVACLNAGLNVMLLAQDVAETDALRERIRGIYDGAVTRGVLVAEARDALLTRLSGAWPADALARTQLVLDTHQIDLQRYLHNLNPLAIWASVTDGGALPQTAPPGLEGRHVVLRVYRPASSAKLVELGVPSGTAADSVVTLAQLFTGMDRQVIRCEHVDGMVGSNMSAAFCAAALTLVRAGANPYRIDAGAEALGFVKGPFRLMDREGLAGVAKRLAGRDTVAPAVMAVLESRIAAGATGRAAGRGFYHYDDAGAHPDPDLPKTAGGAASWTEAELGAALEAALMNEAARLLRLKVVQRASDIDLVVVVGFGFERAKGGPLFQADLKGLLGVIREMQRCAPLSEPLWRPEPMIEDMVKNGTGFFGRPT